MANLIFAHTRFIVSATWTSLKALSVYLVANFHFSQSPPNGRTLIDLSGHQVFCLALAFLGIGQCKGSSCVARTSRATVICCAYSPPPGAEIVISI